MQCRIYFYFFRFLYKKPTQEIYTRSVLVLVQIEKFFTTDHDHIIGLYFPYYFWNISEALYFIYLFNKDFSHIKSAFRGGKRCENLKNILFFSVSQHWQSTAVPSTCCKIERFVKLSHELRHELSHELSTLIPAYRDRTK